MSINTEVLFNNTWNVRISDPGEAAQSLYSALSVLLAQ